MSIGQAKDTPKILLFCPVGFRASKVDGVNSGKLEQKAGFQG